MFQITPTRRYHLKNAPLRRVLVDLRYPLSPRLLTTDGLAMLQTLLHPILPVVRPVVMAGFTVSFGQAAPAVPDPQLTNRYQFANADGLELHLGAQNATLSAPGEIYRDREWLESYFRAAIIAIAEVGLVEQCDRLGIRYINAAAATPSEWTAWFKPEFTGWTETGIVDARAHRVYMQITQLAIDAGDCPASTATVRHGYLPRGVGTDITATAAGTEPSFLVDVDLASERTTPFEPDALSSVFQNLNHEIAAYFRYTLTAAGEAAFRLEQIGE